MTIQQLVRQFIACRGNALAAKRLYRSLARTLHPDKGGTTAEFQALEDIYVIAKKGRSGLTQLRGRIPKRFASTPTEPTFRTRTSWVCSNAAAQKRSRKSPSMSRETTPPLRYGGQHPTRTTHLECGCWDDTTNGDKTAPTTSWRLANSVWRD